MKRFLALMFFMCLLPLGAWAEDYVTVRELYDQTRTPWRQTFSVPNSGRYNVLPDNYTFDVDIVPKVPDVDAFPILELKIKPVELTAEQRSSLHVIEAERGNLSLENPEGLPNFRDHFYSEMHQAENNPMTPEDAAALFVKIANEYLGVDNFQVHGVIGHGAKAKLYGEYLRDGRNAADYDLEMGVYTVAGWQVFHGIPIVNTQTIWDGEGGALGYFTYAQMSAISEAEYSFHGSAMVETNVLYEDVPLLPFDRIVETYEKLLVERTGELDYPLINLADAVLGYQVVQKDPSQPNQGMDTVFIARPVWVFPGYRAVSGEGFGKQAQADYAAQEQNVLEHPEAIRLWTTDFGYRNMAIIDAQTGEWLNADNNWGELCFNTLVGGPIQVIPWP